MKYLRAKDNNCYYLSNLQSRLFEKSSEDGIPSAYFAKVFFNSKYGKMFDDLSFLDTSLNEKHVYEETKQLVNMNHGTIIPPHIMGWIGYLLREWAYVYRYSSKALLGKIPMSYLKDVYEPYHSLDINKAIQLIALDRNINIKETLEDRTYRILKETSKEQSLNDK